MINNIIQNNRNERTTRWSRISSNNNITLITIISIISISIMLAQGFYIKFIYKKSYFIGIIIVVIYC